MFAAALCINTKYRKGTWTYKNVARAANIVCLISLTSLELWLMLANKARPMEITLSNCKSRAGRILLLLLSLSGQLVGERIEEY